MKPALHFPGPGLCYLYSGMQLAPPGSLCFCGCTWLPGEHARPRGEQGRRLLQYCSSQPGWGPAAGCSLKLSVSCPCGFPAWQPDGLTLPQALATATMLCCYHHSLLSAAGSPPLGTGISELLGP